MSFHAFPSPSRPQIVKKICPRPQTLISVGKMFFKRLSVFVTVPFRDFEERQQTPLIAIKYFGLVRG
jgi:hypothetical protein